MTTDFNRTVIMLFSFRTYSQGHKNCLWTPLVFLIAVPTPNPINVSKSVTTIGDVKQKLGAEEEFVCFWEKMEDFV